MCDKVIHRDGDSWHLGVMVQAGSHNHVYRTLGLRSPVE